MSNLRLIHHDTFADLVSAASLTSRAYDRTMETFEAVDRLEEISGIGDRVLMLARSGRLARAQADTLLQELMVCFAEPLERTGNLNEVKRIVRRCDE